ncbi:MAG: hypothetical protein CSA35_03700 [Dethiosulfovibrio peptidovorans]|nr:MAG: hypothetical protein CSA35_03700 [Dethiosulfovibrio peptidovorans]
MRRPGLALPMVLVLLLVGSALVGTAFYLVDLRSSSTIRELRRMDAYSLGLSEIERMVARLNTELDAGRVPRNKEGDGFVSQWDDTSDDVPFDVLAARISGDMAVTRTNSQKNSALTVLYDLVYRHNGLTPLPNIPPQYQDLTQPQPPGFSVVAQNQAQLGQRRLTYMVRTRVDDGEGHVVTLEQVIQRWF